MPIEDNPIPTLLNPIPETKSSTPEVFSSIKKSPFHLRMISIFLFLILLVVGGFILLRIWVNRPTAPTPNLSSKLQQTNRPVKPKADVVLKVGEELIYQKDLDFELAFYPVQAGSVEKNQLLLQKIASDSAVLQGARADGLITLDPTTFNDKNKDYLKRIQLVEKAKGLVNNKTNKVTGVIVSVWFYNFGQPGPLGYEKGQQFALEKITALHKSIQSGRMTAEQAVEAVRNDTSLAQIDPGSYKNNARQAFSATGGDIISQNPQLDASIRKLNSGEVSDIFLSTERGFDKPGFYQFGQVTDKISSGQNINFDNWLKQVQQRYETVIY